MPAALRLARSLSISIDSSDAAMAAHCRRYHKALPIF